MSKMLIIKKKVVSQLDSISNKIRSSIQRDHENSEVPINTLAPKVLTKADDIKKIQPYLISLKQAIDTPGINNTAIAGSYGSGKSTILKTFQDQYQHYKYLNISLASFKDNKDGEDSLERKLEISILQQMFYHVTPSTIPDSRFKRIINITKKKLLFLISFFIAWILSTILLFKFSYIEKIDPQKWHIKYSFDWITFIASLIFFIGIALFIKTVYRLLSNSKISKLNIKGELELGEAVDKSVFNQHLEEILYFFERTEFNVVVIEDVDRFNSTDIFTKLREINILINNSNLIHRQVKFIYAIKDEMFTDKNDRVKFFEHIIPVIPFINPNNANEQLSQLIRGANLQDVLSADFTSDVVTFIDDIDMRLLTNIFQEYQIYRRILNPSLNQDKLFAILVYKNMYPDDFGELSKRKGKLYRFITSKRTYIDSMVRDLNLQIQTIDNQISEIEQEIAKPIKELRVVYISKILEKLDKFHCFYNGTDASISKAVEDTFFNDLKKDINIRYKRYEMHNYSMSISRDIDSGIKLSDIEKEVSQKQTYQQRESALINMANNKVSSLKLDRNNLKNHISELESMSIKEIFEEISIDSHIDEFNDSYLMKSLLVNGYIDEHYDDYISLFHGIALTNEDFVFERNVKSGTILPFDYPLTHIDTLIKKLPEKYFKKITSFNFSVLEYLLENVNKYPEKLNNIIQTLSENGEQQSKFIIEFLKKTHTYKGDFLRRISEKDKNIWHLINTSPELTEANVEELVQLLFEYTTNETIALLTDLDSLKLFIENRQNPITYFSKFISLSTIKKFASGNKIKLKQIDELSEMNSDLFEYFYTNDYYEINADNIFTIIKGYNKTIDKNKLDHSHYTSLKEANLPNLTQYINNNIQEYISNVIGLLPDNTQESADTIVEILNRQELNISSKERFAKAQTCKINSLSKLNNIESKQLLLDLNKIVVTWENIFDYYDDANEEKSETDKTTTFDDTLIQFLNEPRNYMELSSQSIQSASSRDNEYLDHVANVIVSCESLSIESYSHLIKSLPYYWIDFNYALSDDKIEILLEKKKISLTESNFDFLNKKNQSLVIRLIEINQDEFIKNHNTLSIDVAIWVSLFTTSNISLKNKLALLQAIDDSIIIANTALANAVFDILPNDKITPLRYEVIVAMFDAQTSVQKKISMLLLYNSTLDDVQLQNLTEKLGADYEKVFKKKHKPTFPNNKLNLELFKILKERNLIIRSKEESDRQFIKVFAKYQ